MKKMKGSRQMCIYIALCFLLFSITSCNDESDNEGTVGHDPRLPIVVDYFSPTTGARSTQIILYGSNFGYNTDSVKVFFNEKEAPVISAKGDKLLVLAPRLPGENCRIKVRIGGQESIFKDEFDYIIQTNVTTVVGGDRGSTSFPVGTVPLSEAQFNNNMERIIQIDSEGQIYFCIHVGGDKDHVYVINEEVERLRLIDNDAGAWLNSNFVSYDIKNDQIFRFQANIGNNEYWFYDKRNDFAKNMAGRAEWEGESMAPGGWADWSARQSCAMRPSDGQFYFRINGGSFASLNPITGKGKNITGRHTNQGFGTKSGTCRGIAFDPTDDNILYFSVDERHCIYRYDFVTDEITVFAGSENGEAGFYDGERREARFDRPNQISFDKDYNMYIADRMNHCIRKIVMGTGYVSTVAGIPGESGYRDGTNEVARFNEPVGIAVNNEGVIYIGDAVNRAIRRISVE
ncbi:IPT/TIG domain-containing protein [uncultured Proteiniphilum sp.]|uniref:IPT/TIG domain-containing protein n=1 Tax=uncultured Proteiniphilum sp. TaxID=497637 RepID=UPI00263A31C7|nr:IPT/TIG domain-containing protein [uncultured Proteiniphilum sp.]